MTFKINGTEWLRRLRTIEIIIISILRTLCLYYTYKAIKGQRDLKMRAMPLVLRMEKWCTHLVKIAVFFGGGGIY